MRYATAYLFNALTGRTHVAYFRELPHDRGRGLTRWRSQGHHATGTEDERELWKQLLAMRVDVPELQDGKDTWLGSFSWDGNLPVVLEIFDKPIAVDWRTYIKPEFGGLAMDVVGEPSNVSRF
jgi:hypothetical protein